MMNLPQKSTPTLFDIARSRGMSAEQASALIEGSLRDKKKSTRRAYLKSLSVLADYCGAEDVPTFLMQFFGLASFEGNALLMQWRSEMVESKLSPNTINQRLAAVRFFAQLGRTLGLIDWSVEVRGLKVIPYRDTRGCGVEVLKKVLDSIDTKTDSGCRDNLIFRMLYGMGLRRSELVGINWEDIDYDGTRVSILGKGRHQKEWLGFDSTIESALRAWEERKQRFHLDPEDPTNPVFVSLQPKSRGKRLTANGLYRVVGKWGERHGARITPHGIRHTAVTEAIDSAHAQGIGVEKVRDFSRHKDIRTLFIYQDRADNVQSRLTEAISL